ncbi:competence type IV pilus minor pilin ComGD [Metabacillus fastidiosus]|uniref:Competence type IV pilus minor pilin ComGD n=1 Tax=Metabacillus fastidiosus TaxID=1458 RepID=A0ABU6NUV3_9BACI|nr:competence type IV pilus minor pilin ComGD [Metabacillus fastidiosus]MED4400917.1 competence type IV pilus minor pilin ComGD [Metabacillus fastidiosus]MED4463843.1 competence type IV pilus minor pilin ComGD [Metabacillus fastidiosus]
MLLKCNRGFTLLESLLVLMIVSIMSLVTIINIAPVYERKILHTFFEQFEKDVLYAQQHAITYQTSVYIVFPKDEHVYKIQLTELGNGTITRNIDENLTFQFYNIPPFLVYTPSGAMDKSGTMFIHYKDKKYRIVFYLGRGRFNVEEL